MTCPVHDGYAANAVTAGILVFSVIHACSYVKSGSMQMYLFIYSVMC